MVADPEKNWPCSQAPATLPPEQKKIQQFLTDVCEQFISQVKQLPTIVLRKSKTPKLG